MNQTATWDKIWRYSFYNYFTILHHHLEGILIRCRRKLGFYTHRWKNIYRVQIKIGAKTIEARGLYDSGNSLYEPIGHRPVSIIADTLAQALMDEEDWQTRLRMIPYRSIGVHCGLMRGFIADEIIVYEGRYPMRNKSPVLAVANQPFGEADGYQVILHPELI